MNEPVDPEHMQPDNAHLETLVRESAARLFRDHADLQAMNAPGNTDQRDGLWRRLESAGFTKAMVSEKAGGSGLSLSNGFTILQCAGRHAINVPLAETMLAGWLCEKHDLPVPAERAVVADTPLQLSSDRVTGLVKRLPFANEAEFLIARADEGDRAHLVVVPLNETTRLADQTIAGDDAATLNLHSTKVMHHAQMSQPADAISLMGAAMKARMMAGALAQCLELAVTYSGDRQAFGRPIARFQAVQHNLAALAGEVAAADAVSASAANAIERFGLGDPRTRLEISAAKIRCGEAAGKGTRIAHQTFGAIGYTDEHVLHRLTRRLWAWRDEFGSESVWARRLGHHIASNGADEVWPSLTAC